MRSIFLVLFNSLQPFLSSFISFTWTGIQMESPKLWTNASKKFSLKEKFENIQLELENLKYSNQQLVSRIDSLAGQKQPPPGIIPVEINFNR